MSRETRRRMRRALHAAWSGRRPSRALVGGMLVALVAGGVAFADAERDRAPEYDRATRGGARSPTAEETRKAADEADRAARRAVEESKELAPVLYVPPSRGRAQHTAAGGTRGLRGVDPLDVAVLAPSDHIALTTQAQPTLYWFVSEDTNARIDLTVVDEESIDPLLEITVPPPIARGIHALDLAERGVTLETGKVYRWHVAVVRDEQRRAHDIFDQGLIERTQAPSGLAGTLAGSGADYAPYARSGIWYDAMDALQTALSEDPANPGLLAQEQTFLKQLELPQVVR